MTRSHYPGCSAGRESPYHNRGKLGGGRTSPELSPSQFTHYATGGALPSLQFGPMWTFSKGLAPGQGKRRGRGPMRKGVTQVRMEGEERGQG